MSEWSKFLTAAQRTLFTQSHTHHILIERIMIETPKGGRVLEAGCGLAFLSKLIAEAGYRVTAGDIDEEVLAAARADGLHSDDIEYRRVDLFTLGAEEGERYDTIFHSGVLEHFSDELIVEAFRQQRARANKLVFKIPNGRTTMTKAHFGNERFLSNEQWVRLAREGGYRDVRVYGGESAPKWAQLLPAILHSYPKAGQKPKRIRFHERLSAWRRLFSRHTIFVCS